MDKHTPTPFDNETISVILSDIENGEVDSATYAHINDLVSDYESLKKTNTALKERIKLDARQFHATDKKYNIHEDTFRECKHYKELLTMGESPEAIAKAEGR